MKAILLLVIMGCCAVACQDAQKYCGRRLASALAYFCDGNLMKRSFDFEDSWPWHEVRSKRQIVQECCENPCPINVLLSYCSA